MLGYETHTSPAGLLMPGPCLSLATDHAAQGQAGQQIHLRAATAPAATLRPNKE